MAVRHPRGKDKTGGGVRSDALLAAKLHRTIALALENGGNGGIVGLDQLRVAQLLAVGQPSGLMTDGGMVMQRRGEGQGGTLTLARTQRVCLFEALLGLESKGVDRRTEGQALLFRVAYQLDEDWALTATASAKTTHDLGEFRWEASGLALEPGSPVTALRDDVGDEGECFFVLYTAWWHR